MPRLARQQCIDALILRRQGRGRHRSRRPPVSQFFHHVIHLLHQFGPVPEQLVATRAEPRAHVTGHRKDFAALFGRVRHGNQRAALCGCFDDHDAQTQTADNAVAPRKRPPIGLGPEGKFGDDRTALADRAVEPAMAGGIDHIGAAAQHRDGAATDLQRCLVGGAVNAVGQTADDADAARDETVRQFAGDLHAVFRGFARPDNRHGRPHEIIRPQREEQRRRSGYLPQ